MFLGLARTDAICNNMIQPFHPEGSSDSMKRERIIDKTFYWRYGQLDAFPVFRRSAANRARIG